MVSDADTMPLTRSRCLFKVLQILKLTRGSDGRFAIFSGLLSCTDRGVIGADSERETFGISIALGRRLAELDLENPRASRRSRRSRTQACTRLSSRSVPLSSCQTGA